MGRFGLFVSLNATVLVGSVLVGSLLVGCGVQNGGVSVFPAEGPLEFTVNPVGVERERRRSIVAEVVGLDPSASGGEEASSAASSTTEIPAEYFGSIETHRGPINTIAINAIGNSIYTGGQDGRVVITTLNRDNRSSKASAYQFFTEELLIASKPPNAIALSRDESKIAVAFFSMVLVIDLKERKTIARLTRIKGRIISLAWDPRGESLALGRSSGDIYVWNFVSGKDAGQDSLRALELYRAATSPIVDLVFHPSGRAFFAAERRGAIYLWRLLRTERELGLRDESAVIDAALTGKQLVVVGSMGEQLQGMWLSESGEELLAMAGAGQVSRWKIRGLKAQKNVTAGTESVSAAQGFDLPRKGSTRTGGSGDSTIPLFFTGGRGQRLKIWCRSNAVADQRLRTQVSILSPETADEFLETPTKIVPNSATQGRLGGGIPPLLGQSVLFNEPLDMIRVGSSLGLVWATERSGKVVVFDPRALAREGLLRQDPKQCLEGAS